MEREKVSDRREFLKESAGSVGALTLGVLPAAARGAAADRLRVGILGCGSRGGSLLAWTLKLAAPANVDVVAVADLWARRREAAAERVRQHTGRLPALCRTANELLERDDVDAVLIATPDFQHARQAADAARAGKDVYVEKPFGCDWAETCEAADQIAASGRVFQLGAQSFGSDRHVAAARFVQSGRLGQVTYVEIAEPIFQQRWRAVGSETILRQGDVDWREYLGRLPKDLPFNPRHYLEFRLFWPFSSGPFCQWMSHRIAMVNRVLGQTPIEAVSLGGVFLWKDGRTNPDTVQCLLKYPSGVLASYHMRMGNSHGGRATTIYGTAGVLEIESGIAHGAGGGGLVIEGPTREGEKTYHVDRGRLLKARREGGISLSGGEEVDFLADFFARVRDRRPTRCGLADAVGQSVATIMAARAYRESAVMRFDPSHQTMEPSGPAARSLA